MMNIGKHKKRQSSKKKQRTYRKIRQPKQTISFGLCEWELAQKKTKKNPFLKKQQKRKQEEKSGCNHWSSALAKYYR